MRLVLGAAFWAALACTPACASFSGVPLQPCDNRPPLSAQQPVSVAFSVLTVPGQDMFAVCRKLVSTLVIYGCTFPATASRPAMILLNADQDPSERACTLLYEKAHLPPNDWQDPAMETRTPDAKRPQPTLARLVH
jgi:hypothetical protein